MNGQIRYPAVTRARLRLAGHGEREADGTGCGTAKARSGKANRARRRPGNRVLPRGAAERGQKSWAVRGRLDGKPIKVTLGAYPVLGLEEARKRAGEALDALAVGRDPRQARAEARAAEEQRRNETVGAVLDEFEKRHAGKLKSGREAMRAASDRERLADSAPRRSIHCITRRDVLKVLDAAVDRGSDDHWLIVPLHGSVKCSTGVSSAGSSPRRRTRARAEAAHPGEEAAIGP